MFLRPVLAQCGLISPEMSRGDATKLVGARAGVQSTVSSKRDRHAPVPGATLVASTDQSSSPPGSRTSGAVSSSDGIRAANRPNPSIDEHAFFAQSRPVRYFRGRQDEIALKLVCWYPYW